MLTEVDVRRRRIGGAFAAAIGIALLVLAVMAMTGKLGATQASKGASDAAKSAGATSGSASESASESAEPTSESANTKAPLTVLNASSTKGLAAKGQEAFTAEGWEVTSTGNLTTGAPAQSTVYYPADDEEAHVAAQSLVKQFPKLVAEKAPANLGHPGVVVVLTGDWTPGE